MPYPSPWLPQSGENPSNGITDARAENGVDAAADDYERENELESQSTLDRAQQAAQDQCDCEEDLIDPTNSY